jgi:hypothetical protein
MTMFENEKLRKKGLLGILAALMLMGIFAFKFFFNDPDEKINKEIAEGVKLINKSVPVIIDSLYRLDFAAALPERILQFNYTILNVEKSEIDTSHLKSTAKELMIENLKSNPKVALFREYGIRIQSIYKDESGDQICKVEIMPEEY